MKKKNTAFTVELLGLFILLILVITIVTQVFVMSRSHSLQARQLTEAVIAAESMAEICSSEQEMDSLAGKLADAGGDDATVRVLENGDNGLILALPYEGYTVRIDRTMQQSGAGVYAEDIISIYDGTLSNDDAVALAEGTEAIYTLKAGKFFEEGKR